MEEGQSKKGKAGRKPKYDYTSESFLSMIADYAKRTCTDTEIAQNIGLSVSEFCKKKTEFPQIAQTLSHARSGINTVVRGTFLKTALGGRLIKTYSYVQKRCECRGNDPKCPICDGTGWITPEQHRVVTETEQAPNPMVQIRWLMNYDTDFRKRTKGEADDELPQNIQKGVDIKDWLKKELEDIDGSQS